MRYLEVWVIPGSERESRN